MKENNYLCISNKIWKSTNDIEVFSDDIEVLFIEINFRKWLLYDIYHPLAQSDQHYFDNLDNALDV